MILVFIFLVMLILISFAMLLLALSNIQIELKQLHISNNKGKLKFKVILNLSIILFNRLKIIKLSIDNKKIIKILKSGKINFTNVNISKENIKDYFYKTNIEHSKYLLKLDNALDFLYQEWLRTDGGIHNILDDSIVESLYKLNELDKKRKMSKER